MGKRIVKYRDCDRCPRNRKPNRATSTVPFSFGQVKWKIDLCDECKDKMEREFYAWGRLGEEVEDTFATARFTAEAAADARRAAELRGRHREDIEPARTGPAPEKYVHKRAAHLADVPAGLPDEAKEWVFTEHAIERMKERNVGAVQALFAALLPEVQRAGDRDGVMVCYARGVKAVVDVNTQEVLTVAREEYAHNQIRKAN